MGDIERLVAEADDGTVDEQFLQHLYRGGELLSGGKAHEAKDELEKAFKLQPKNPKAQNLLGLTYFKLGNFERASEIYELLVRDNPVDPTLRVNLGLVYLKQNALQRATREFETAVDLAPDHKKAQNYLGLACAQAGDFARAKDCFVAAGSLTMAERMERALKDPSKAPRVAMLDGAKGASDPEPSAPTRKELEVEIDVEPERPAPAAASGNWGQQVEAVAPAPVPAVAAAPAPVPALSVVPAPRPAAPAPPTGATLMEIARSAALPAAAGEEPFVVSGEDLVVRVRGEIFARLDGLLAVNGAMQYVPEMKRFRGKATDKAFGDGEQRMVRVSGSGLLHLARRERHFVSIELAQESAYFREDLVFGFEESVVFENGRVPSKIAPDLHLVHLRGKGRVLLGLQGPLLSSVVKPDLPCVIPMTVLVGWSGNLTPRIVGIPEETEAGAAIPSVALSGEGFALLSD